MIINNSKLLRVRFTVFVANERILKEMERKSERNMKKDERKRKRVNEKKCEEVCQRKFKGNRNLKKWKGREREKKCDE